MNSKILNEIVASKLMIAPQHFAAVEKLLNTDGANGTAGVEMSRADKVAILPIVGPMFKYDSWFAPGIDTIADYLRVIDNSTEFAGTVLMLNTPGGSSQSLIQIKDALKNRTKPVVAFVDGMACSCGMYVASFCDHIMAADEMAEVGSIGVYTQLVDDREYYEKMGVKLIEVYPDESALKNKPYRDALNGDTKTLIDESLAPFARHFQEIVRTNRPQLNESAAPGILNGRVLYATDAVNCGLIDSIGNLDAAISKVYEIEQAQNELFY